MARLALLFCLTFAFSFSLSSCGGQQCSAKNCVGCCDVAGVCHGGDEVAFCGAMGNACMVCDTTQACSANACVVAVVDAGCAPTPVLCSDQAIAQLTLYQSVSPASATITNTADGGEFLSDIIATGGGLSPSQSYVYARFTDTGLEKVPVGDVAALDSMDWDIALRRFVVRLNGGDSGPSCVGAQLVGSNTFDTVTAAPPSAVYATDNFLDDANACAFINDQSGLTTSPSLALSTVSPAQSYYSYSSCVAMTGQVAVVRLRSGRTLKLTMTRYYQTAAAQVSCNSTGSSNMTAGGYIQLRWAYLP